MPDKARKLHIIRIIRILVKGNELRPMTIFDDYIRNKGCCKVSKTLLWDYDLTQFDWQRSRKVVVQRIIERGWLRDYFAAFDLYGGIEGFREIIKEVPTLSAQDMNFVCTALTLYLGHRVSVDLDLFTPESFDVGELEAFLSQRYGFQTAFRHPDTLKGMIDGVKIDCIAHKYAYLRRPYAESGIRLYSIKDIVAMKLSAIADDGSPLKDFVDIACLSTRIPFYEMLKCYERQFPQANVIRPFKALTYFDDIDFGKDIVMLNFEYGWKQIARRLKEMTVRQEHVFSQWPLKEQKLPVAEDKDTNSMKRGRKR